MTRIRKYTYDQETIDRALGETAPDPWQPIGGIAIELIAEYFGYEDGDLDEWKKDAETLTNEQIVGIYNLVKRHKETHD